MTDLASLQPVRTGHILETFAKLYSNEFSLLEPQSDGRPFPDLLAATDSLGDLTVQGCAVEYLEESKAELEVFNDTVSRYHLY